MKVRSYKANRGGRTVSVGAHSKGDRFRSIKSSCINEVSQRSTGEKFITIRGREYPYPELPKEKVSGLVSASSAGRYYNKNIRGKFF